jgi:hypothetical protein
VLSEPVALKGVFAAIFVNPGEVEVQVFTAEIAEKSRGERRDEHESA